jgi:hypothetical protein
VLILLDFDRHGCDLVIKLTVASDLLGIALVPGVGHCFLKNLKVTP